MLLGCFLDAQHAYALFRLNRHGRLHPLVAPPLPQVPGGQEIVPNTFLVYPLLTATTRTGHPRQRRRLLYFGPLPTTPRGNTYTFLATDHFSRRADMYATTEAEFTASGKADILFDHYTPLWGCHITLLSGNGLQFCSKLSRALYERLGINKTATSFYQPCTNGGVERVNHTMALMLAMVGDEEQ